MRVPQTAIRTVREGDLLSAAEWNRLVALVKSTLLELGTGQDRAHLPAAAVMMRIVSSDGDYWTCRRFDGTTAANTDEYVAKPWDIRPSVTTIGSTTFVYTTDILRTATLSGDDEEQMLTPDFVANESVIWAAKARNTGVEVAGGSHPITWLDLNVSGRVFAKSPP